ncbi:MAG TPA: diaminopimelate dehydrogenase [Dysgonamonadaceae bacterium]|jgi:diaminopimelate dehydrogenase|nr:diaminopimelate dehydrogenase [Dysgonamonadaceae bacterium]
MIKKTRAAIIGYGNIGKYVIDTILHSSDFEIVGIVRRNPSDTPPELKNFVITDSITKLTNVDVAILCLPSRIVENAAKECLALGINTVDSFDIHSKILSLRNSLSVFAKKQNAVAVVSAGWDPGSDSIVRALMQAMSPSGITYTNFGPGMSMGHTVAAKAIDGVENALSMTIPTGTGIHRRMVYVEIKEGYKLDEIAHAIKTDDYFAKDETHVFQVNDINELKDMGHGVEMNRKGASGNTQNQLFSFDMKVNNPALTAQMLINAARASFKLHPGAYTLIEIPVINFLPGKKEEWIEKLV